MSSPVTVPYNTDKPWSIWTVLPCPDCGGHVSFYDTMLSVDPACLECKAVFREDEANDRLIPIAEWREMLRQKEEAAKAAACLFPCSEGLNRYWVSWWSAYRADEGCTKPPFQIWSSGFRERADGVQEDSFCAMLDLADDVQIAAELLRWFPDATLRFCEPRDHHAVPGDRFPGFRGKTLLEDTHV
jgi:hypothetical protein